MGVNYSSQQLAVAVQGGVPTASYAYASSNSKLFGVDATYSFWGNPVGEYTPYLVQSAAPTATCSPLTLSVSGQSIDCPLTGRDLTSGQYTFVFSQYVSTTSVDSAGVTQTYKATTDGNSLYNLGGALTFSIVKPTTTVTVTPSTATTTVISGISELPATQTITVPKSTYTVTVYQTTIISTQTSLSTLTGAGSTVTVTGTCSSTSTSKPATTLLSCNRDNCLRALVGKSVDASSFCSKYTKTTGLPTPTYASQCSGLASRVSSACSCLVTQAAATVTARGREELPYGPPDFTYSSGGASPVTLTVTASPSVIITSGPIPSSTLTDPDSTFTSGTATSTDTKPSTVTVTVFRSSVDSRTVRTVTVAPSTCK